MVKALVIAGDVIGFILLAYLLAWALLLAVSVFLLIVAIVSRGRSDAVRNAFRYVVAAGAPAGSLRAGPAGRGGGVMPAIRKLQAADPGFDLTAFLDNARVAVGAYAMAYSAEDDRLLRRVTTPGFWQTPNGKEVAAIVANWQRYAGDRPGTANRGRMVLDISWRRPEVTNVALAEQGMDRITVRLASLTVVAVLPGGPRIDEATQFDWEFARPAGQRTDPGSVMLPRTCARCGGPYHSDLDDACHYCHTARADSQAGWRLDRNYLVVRV
jgi:predicted lipid-binding transport protein (Tim44 family)